MSTTRLQLYNNALIICGERSLASLTENREPRRVLDQIWDSGGVKGCLEAGQWKFAMRGVRIDYTTSITPDFGYQRAFEKPSDWCVTSAISEEEYFRVPLLEYIEEAGYWYAAPDTIYVRYVSDDASFGGDMSLWPSRFSDYAAAAFAAKAILKLSADEKKRDGTLKYEQKQLLAAKNSDAMSEPTKFPPTGAWNTSRFGHRGGRDRGNRNSLIG